MTHYSPQVALVQTIVSLAVFIFFLWHSWKFDRFRNMCFWRRRDQGRGHLHLGMRYLHLFSLPAFAVQGGVMTFIKYKMGLTGGFPVPYFMWPESYQRLIFPLSLVQAFSWSAESVVHLEELCFWIFLIGLTPKSRRWLTSTPFSIFVVGSALVSAIMFAVVILLRSDPLRTEAMLYLIASTFNTAGTAAFIWVIRVFPGWLDELRRAGAPSELVIRLYGFGQLNVLRTAARFAFLLPILVLSADGATKAQTLNRMPWVVDLLLILGMIAFAGQATITLLIFLPRNRATECGFTLGTLSSRYLPLRSPGRSYPPSLTQSRKWSRTTSQSGMLSQEQQGFIYNPTQPYAPCLSSPSPRSQIASAGLTLAPPAVALNVRVSPSPHGWRNPRAITPEQDIPLSGRHIATIDSAILPREDGEALHPGEGHQAPFFKSEDVPSSPRGEGAAEELKGEAQGLPIGPEPRHAFQGREIVLADTLIHPAVRNFQSPIDVFNGDFWGGSSPI